MIAMLMEVLKRHVAQEIIVVSRKALPEAPAGATRSEKPVTL